ncbi:hypothetical protein BDW62DRAFT_63378 [Aspergillus aurantiobrunneus]
MAGAWGINIASLSGCVLVCSPSTAFSLHKPVRLYKQFSATVLHRLNFHQPINNHLSSCATWYLKHKAASQVRSVKSSLLLD